MLRWALLRLMENNYGGCIKWRVHHQVDHTTNGRGTTESITLNVNKISLWSNRHDYDDKWNQGQQMSTFHRLMSGGALTDFELPAIYWVSDPLFTDDAAKQVRRPFITNKTARATKPNAKHFFLFLAIRNLSRITPDFYDVHSKKKENETKSAAPKRASLVPLLTSSLKSN